MKEEIINIVSEEVPTISHFYFGLVRHDAGSKWFPTAPWEDYESAVMGLGNWTGAKEKKLIKVAIPSDLLE